MKKLILHGRYTTTGQQMTIIEMLYKIRGRPYRIASLAPLARNNHILLWDVPEDMSSVLASIAQTQGSGDASLTTRLMSIEIHFPLQSMHLDVGHLNAAFETVGIPASLLEQIQEEGNCLAVTQHSVPGGKFDLHITTELRHCIIMEHRTSREMTYKCVRTEAMLPFYQITITTTARSPAHRGAAEAKAWELSGQLATALSS